MSDPLDVLHRPNGRTEPEPEFRARLMAQLRDALADPSIDLDARLSGASDQPIASVDQPVPVEIVIEPAQRRPTKRNAHARVVAVAAAVLALVLTFVAVRDPNSPSTVVPATIAPPTPPAPMATPEQLTGLTFTSLTVVGGQLVQQFGTFNPTSLFPGSAEAAALEQGSPWREWSDSSVSVTDVDARGGGFYIVTCCGPNGTVWRNGARASSGTKIDLLMDGVRTAIVDPATGAVYVGDVVGNVALVEPGAIDAAWLDRTTLAVLVRTPEPAIVVLSARDFAEAPPQRRVVALPPESTDACAIVNVNGRLVLLLGEARGNDLCVGDRGQMVGPQDGALEASFDFPVEIRGMNSNHAACLIVVTTEGDVVLGEFDPMPQWSTLLMGDYVAAMIG